MNAICGTERACSCQAHAYVDRQAACLLTNQCGRQLLHTGQPRLPQSLALRSVKTAGPQPAAGKNNTKPGLASPVVPQLQPVRYSQADALGLGTHHTASAAAGRSNQAGGLPPPWLRAVRGTGEPGHRRCHRKWGRSVWQTRHNTYTCDDRDRRARAGRQAASGPPSGTTACTGVMPARWTRCCQSCCQRRPGPHSSASTPLSAAHTHHSQAHGWGLPRARRLAGAVAQPSSSRHASDASRHAAWGCSCPVCYTARSTGRAPRRRRQQGCSGPSEAPPTSGGSGRWTGPLRSPCATWGRAAGASWARGRWAPRAPAAAAAACSPCWACDSVQ